MRKTTATSMSGKYPHPVDKSDLQKLDVDGRKTFVTSCPCSRLRLRGRGLGTPSCMNAAGQSWNKWNRALALFGRTAENSRWVQFALAWDPEGGRRDFSN